jgi:hypothetical protein
MISNNTLPMILTLPAFLPKSFLFARMDCKSKYFFKSAKYFWKNDFEKICLKALPLCSMYVYL